VQKAGKGGYWYLALIGFFLAVIGGVFVVILAKGYLKAKETRSWDIHQGRVLVSEVGERVLGPNVPPEYTHKLLFEYRVGGERFTGDRVKRRENPYFKEKAKAERWAEDWLVETEVEVFVNPTDPKEAVLDHDTKAAGYTIWFPGLFLVGGLVVLIKSLLAICKKPVRVTNH